MSEPATTPSPTPAPLNAGDSFGFYKVAEFSPSRIFLRADYFTGLLLLVAGVFFLLLDIAIFSHSAAIVSFMRLIKVHSFLYTFRDFIIGLPKAFQGAMLVLPVIGIGWFFGMTGRSILVDFTRRIASKRKFFAFGPTADLGAAKSLRLHINGGYTPSRGDSVSLHLTDAQGSSLMELGDEVASADEFDSTPTTDYAKLLRITAHIAGTLRIPIAIQGKPDKMSAINRGLLESTVG